MVLNDTRVVLQYNALASPERKEQSRIITVGKKRIKQYKEGMVRIGMYKAKNAKRKIPDKSGIRTHALSDHGTLRGD